MAGKVKEDRVTGLGLLKESGQMNENISPTGITTVGSLVAQKADTILFVAAEFDERIAEHGHISGAEAEWRHMLVFVDAD